MIVKLLAELTSAKANKICQHSVRKIPEFTYINKNLSENIHFYNELFNNCIVAVDQLHKMNRVRLKIC